MVEEWGPDMADTEIHHIEAPFQKQGQGLPSAVSPFRLTSAHRNPILGSPISWDSKRPE